MSTADLPLTLTAGGLTYVNRSANNLEAAGVPDSVILPAYVAKLKAMIDEAAEKLRASVITPGSGQVMEYEEARSQATAALAASSTATAALYPMLAASIGIDIDPSSNAPATDVLGVARAVMAAYAAWATLGAAIRGVRVQGKAAVAAATSVAAATAAYSAVVWPSTSAAASPPST